LLEPFRNRDWLGREQEPERESFEKVEASGKNPQRACQLKGYKGSLKKTVVIVLSDDCATHRDLRNGGRRLHKVS